MFLGRVVDTEELDGDWMIRFADVGVEPLRELVELGLY